MRNRKCCRQWVWLIFVAGCAVTPPAPPTSSTPGANDTRIEAPRALQNGLETRVAVITYHDIVKGKKEVWFDTTVDEFKEQIERMQNGKSSFLTLAGLDHRLTEGMNVPERTYLITFSDGYRGVHEYAWPILREHRIPFVVFMHTGFVGSSQGRPKMTWDQLRELDRSGLGRVESQTVSHPEDLRKLSDEALAREFMDSKKKLEDELGREVTAVAYPNGKFDERVAQTAKECGYRLGFTEELVMAEASPDLWRIGRFLHSKAPLP